MDLRSRKREDVKFKFLILNSQRRINDYCDVVYDNDDKEQNNAKKASPYQVMRDFESLTVLS